MTKVSRAGSVSTVVSGSVSTVVSGSVGLCAEASGDLEKAYRYYKDVYSTDVGFEDLSERMLAVSQALKAQG